MKHVHILISVRKPELLDAALLVFQTIRVGFPTALIHVWGNNLNSEYTEIFSNKGIFHNLPTICHDEWIENLILNNKEPFWICDTDIVFFDKVEDWTFKESIAGRYQHSYREPWSNTHYIERLHPCLMWINPVRLRGNMAKWSKENIPAIFHSGQVPFIRQNFIPHKGITYLYDTCAGLYHTCPCHSFTNEENAAFEHLHAGTYADTVSKDCIMLKDLYIVHQQIYKEPFLARGLKQIQDKFYNTNRIIL